MALCKPIYTDTDTDTVASTNIRPYIYGVYIRRIYPYTVLANPNLLPIFMQTVRF